MIHPGSCQRGRETERIYLYRLFVKNLQNGNDTDLGGHPIGHRTLACLTVCRFEDIAPDRKKGCGSAVESGKARG